MSYLLWFKVITGLLAVCAFGLLILVGDTIRMRIQESAWWQRKLRHIEVTRLILLGEQTTLLLLNYAENVDSTFHFNNLRDGLRQLVENYNNDELSDVSTTIELELMAWPDTPANGHGVLLAQIGVTGSAFIITDKILTDDTLPTNIKCDAALMLARSVMVIVNRMKKERVSLCRL